MKRPCFPIGAGSYLSGLMMNRAIRSGAGTFLRMIMMMSAYMFRGKLTDRVCHLFPALIAIESTPSHHPVYIFNLQLPAVAEDGVSQCE